MMLSRIADSLFWLNRYMERTDAMLRILRTNYVLALDKGEFGVTTWKPVLQMFTQHDESRTLELEKSANESLQFLILEAANINSVKAIVTRARENARGAQDHITKEVWEQVNQMYHLVNNPLVQLRMKNNDPLAVLDNLLDNALLYNGVTDSTMPRTMGWSFMCLGKFIERCLITLEVTNHAFGAIDYELEQSQDILFWRNLLFSLSGYEMHLKTYRSGLHNSNVADQVFFNKQFTRSLIYSLDRIDFYLKKVVDENKPERSDELLKLFGRLHSAVEYSDGEYLRQTGPKQFILGLRTTLLQFNRTLGQLFFSYS